MIAAVSETRVPVSETLREFAWRHPEWWSMALSGAAWAALLVAGARHAGHEMHHRMSFGQELEHWMLMVAAMMLPVTVEAIRNTAVASLWVRRNRAIAGFLAGYFAPWLAAGLVAAWLREIDWTHSYAAAALAFLVAALWQVSSMHARALMGCHRRQPLAPGGWQADWDCVRSGAGIGAACVGSCWALMLACTFAGHGFAALAGGMVIGVMERTYFRPKRREALVTVGALAAYYLVAGIRAQFPS